MEYQFKKTECPCLKNLFSQAQTMEQTALVRLSDQSPGAERIIAAWGQPLLRSKEWRSGEITVAAGLMVWVLIQPEEGKTPVCVDSWIPFSFRWDLPADTSEGTVRVSCLCGGVDARLVSQGKIQIRGTMSALAESWCAAELELYQPEDSPERLELLQSEYPVRLPVEAGERTFELDEVLSLPASAPEPEKLISCQLQLSVGDCRILAGKLVFRGTATAHMLYLSREGQLHSWDFEVPVSQYAQLEGSVSPDAGAGVLPAVTAMEAELDGDGRLHLKAQMTGQYVVEDRKLLSITEDAYIPGENLQVEKEMLDVPAILDTRRQILSGEQTAPAEGDLVVDAAAMPEFPRLRRTADAAVVELAGVCQVLYYDGSGQLRCAAPRWEESCTLKADASAGILALPVSGQCHAMPGSGSMVVQHSVDLELTVLSGQGIPMITALELESEQKKNPQRPSLILRRAEQSLWETAKKSGSTVSAIRKANGLEQEPAPGQMLLIPVL